MTFHKREVFQISKFTNRDTWQATQCAADGGLARLVFWAEQTLSDLVRLHSAHSVLSKDARDATKG